MEKNIIVAGAFVGIVIGALSEPNAGEPFSRFIIEVGFIIGIFCASRREK